MATHDGEEHRAPEYLISVKHVCVVVVGHDTQESQDVKGRAKGCARRFGKLCVTHEKRRLTGYSKQLDL